MRLAFSFNYHRTAHFSRNVVSLSGRCYVEGRAGTALYDAHIFGVDGIAVPYGRRVMVIVTDGGEPSVARIFTRRSIPHSLPIAPSIPILVVPIENDAGRNIGGENALTNLARGTGGQVFVPTLGASMDKAFDQIIRALRTQYFLGYYPKNVPLTKDRFHRLDVRVNGQDLQVLARSGYYGDASNDSGGSDDRISIQTAAASAAGSAQQVILQDFIRKCFISHCCKRYWILERTADIM